MSRNENRIIFKNGLYITNVHDLSVLHFCPCQRFCFEEVFFAHSTFFCHTTIKMPSRGEESKHGGSCGAMEEDVHFSEQVLSAAIEFCASPAFQDPVKEFKLSHLHMFTEYCDCKSQDVEDVEQSLECGEAFADYQLLVEALLESFAKRHGSSAQEFFRECSDAVEGKFVPLFEEHENKW